jgi:hypothetical protein
MLGLVRCAKAGLAKSMAEPPAIIAAPNATFETFMVSCLL